MCHVATDCLRGTSGSFIISTLALRRMQKAFIMNLEALSQPCKSILIREFRSTRPQTLAWQTRAVWSRRFHVDRTSPSSTNSHSSTVIVPGKDGLSSTFRQRTESVAPNSGPGHGHRRCFTNSPPKLATIVTANPRKDEDGKDMLVDITARASNACYIILPG